MAFGRIIWPAFAIIAVIGIGGPAVGAMLEGMRASETGERSADVLPKASPISEGQGAKVVSSNEPGALRKPDQWTCDYLLPDYQSWLEEGKSPEDWPMARHTYIDVESGERYNWGDWIDWVNGSDCVPVGLVKPEALPLAGSFLGPLFGVGGAAGAAATVVSAGSDSPG